MKWIPFAVSVVLFVIAAAAPSTFAADPPSAESILKILRERDAKFDNVHLQYIQTGEHLQRSSGSGFVRNGVPATAPAPSIMQLRYNKSLVLRPKQVTMISIADEALSKTQRDSHQPAMVPFNKVATSDGTLRAWTVTSSEPGHGHAMLRIEPLTEAQQSLSDEHVMAIRFAFGFGFGQYIQTIDAVEKENANLKIHGTIRIWKDDQSTFQMVLDDHYLVRDAAIKIDTANGKRLPLTILVKSEGIASIDSFELARTGSYDATPRTEKFNVEFVKATFHLSDEDFKTQTAITPDAGTQVNDAVTNQTYFINDPSAPRPLRGVAPPAAP